MANVINNESASRFEAHEGGAAAILQYKLSPTSITMIHTEVPAELEGKGLGGQLARAGLDYARSHQLHVIPLCPFVAGYIKRHPEYLDLVPQDHRARVSNA